MKYGRNNKNRFVSIMISLMLVTAMVFSDAAPVLAVESETKDPLEDTVVVLMKDDSLKTETKVRKTLSAGEEPVKDISVEDVWTFENETSGMKLNGSDDSGEPTEDDAVVALVSSDSMSADKLVKTLNKRKDVQMAEKNFKVHAVSVSRKITGAETLSEALKQNRVQTQPAAGIVSGSEAQSAAGSLSGSQAPSVIKNPGTVGSGAVTNDPYNEYQWSMKSRKNAPNIEYEWNEKGVTGSDKIVAILDSGVDYTHPDLKDNMWVNTHKQLKGEHGFDFIAGDPDPMDENGHGTHCAGVVGAVGNNNIGISGVNQNIRIMALRTLDSDGSSFLSHEVAAYNYISKALDLGEPVVAINNSWNGGDYSYIFEKLIDIVGDKGAATVTSAGNNAVNTDDDKPYPAVIDSPYLIDVAATDRSGSLAYYSCYGESVDIAAPGSEILSTVTDPSYNPAIYGDEQDDISAEYNGYDDDTNTFGFPEKIYVNGRECEKTGGVYVGKEGQEITVSKVEDGFADDDQNSLEIIYNNLKESDVVSFLVPYEIEDDAAIRPTFSLMCKTTGPDDAIDSSVFFASDIAEDEKPNLVTLNDKPFSGYYVIGAEPEWDHLEFGGDNFVDPEPGDKRYFAVSMYAVTKGDFSARIDDIGISRQDISKSRFGKYNFMSGTSMSAPYISGALALIMAEREQHPEAGKATELADVLNEMSAMAKEEPKLPIGAGGAFDFRVVPTVLPPKVGKAWVDTSSDTIKISGSGLDPDQEDFKVELGESDSEMREAEVIRSKSTNGREIYIKNDGWINNVENIRVTGANNRVSRKKNVYLVNGKKEYTKANGITLDISEEAAATDGKNIYTAWSSSREIRKQDPADRDNGCYTIATVTSTKHFKVNRDRNERYGLLFGNDMVYANNRLYTVIEYGAAEEIEEDDSDVLILSHGKKGSPEKSEHRATADDSGSEGSDGYDDGVDEFEGPYAIYSGEYKLVSASTAVTPDDEAKEVTDLGKLPAELEDLEGYAMAAYNGRIYFIGGSRGYGETMKVSNKVFIFDPATGKWSNGPALPSPRTGGKAVQYKGSLIYTMGLESGTGNETEMPDNLIFDGKTWRACSVKNTAEKMYGVDVLYVGLTAKGLIYSGAPVYDLGDTYIYDAAANKYVDTGYNYLADPEEYGPWTIVVGNTLYGIDAGDLYTMPVESGLMNLTVKKTGKGKVTGAGGYMPGNDAKVTLKASKHYHIKSIKVDGKAVKVKSGTTKKTVKVAKMTKNTTVKVVFEKDKKVKVSVKKRGRGKVKGAGKHYVGSKVKIRVTAARGYYIKSLKVGKKKIKLSRKPSKKVYTIKKIKKAVKVRVVFAKK